jgi:hypothetical protein
MSSKKDKKKYISKSELPEVLLYYDYDKKIIDLYILLSFLSFLILQTNYWISINYIILIFFYIGSVFLFGMGFYLSKKTLKEVDSPETVSELISYFNEKGKRVNKKIKKIVESIKTATKNYERLFWFDRINKYLLCFTSLLFIPMNIILLIQFRVFNFPNLNESGFWQFYMIEFFISSYFIIYFGFRKKDFTNLSRSVDYFKEAIENEISLHIEQIHEIAYTKTKDVELRYDEIINAMNNWYDVYCCIYFSNETLNEIHFLFVREISYSP